LKVGDDKGASIMGEMVSVEKEADLIVSFYLSTLTKVRGCGQGFIEPPNVPSQFIPEVSFHAVLGLLLDAV